jgi:hypothetical protein
VEKDHRQVAEWFSVLKEGSGKITSDSPRETLNPGGGQGDVTGESPRETSRSWWRTRDPSANLCAIPWLKGESGKSVEENQVTFVRSFLGHESWRLNSLRRLNKFGLYSHFYSSRWKLSHLVTIRGGLANRQGRREFRGKVRPIVSGIIGSAKRCIFAY